jgi:hypothetical protein
LRLKISISRESVEICAILFNISTHTLIVFFWRCNMKCFTELITTSSLTLTFRWYCYLSQNIWNFLSIINRLFLPVDIYGDELDKFFMKNIRITYVFTSFDLRICSYNFSRTFLSHFLLKKFKICSLLSMRRYFW